MNSVNIAGYLATEPAQIGREGGSVGVRFRVAARDLRFSNDTYFIPCVAWTQTAKFVLDYLHKGDFVIASGRLVSRDFTTSDGRNASSLEAVIDTLRTAPRGRTGDGDFRPARETRGSYGSSRSRRGSVPVDDSAGARSLTGELQNLDAAFPDTVDLNVDDSFPTQTIEPDQTPTVQIDGVDSGPGGEETVSAPWLDDLED